MGSSGGENGHHGTLDLRGVAIRDGAGARPAAALFLRSI